MKHHDDIATKSRESARKRQRGEVIDGTEGQQHEQVESENQHDLCSQSDEKPALSLENDEWSEEMHRDFEASIFEVGLNGVGGQQQEQAEPEKQHDACSRSDEKPAVSSEDDEWSEEMHRDFVAGIFEFGLKHSSPSVLLEILRQKYDSITSEHLKSHLQKYRSAKEKNKKKFMLSYSDWLSQVQDLGISPEETTDIFLSGNLSSGETAAYLTYMSMCETDREKQKSKLGNYKSDSSHKTRPSLTRQSVAAPAPKEYLSRSTSRPYLRNLLFPQLTDQEKLTPLGESMAFLFGVASSLSRHVTRNRLQSSATNSEPIKQNDHPAIGSQRVSSDPLPLAVDATIRNDPSVSHPLSTVGAYISAPEQQVHQQQTAELHGHYTSPNQHQMQPAQSHWDNSAAASQLQPLSSPQYHCLEVQHYNHLRNDDLNQEHPVNSSGDRAHSNVENVQHAASTIPDENTELYCNDGYLHPQQYSGGQPPASRNDSR